MYIYSRLMSVMTISRKHYYYNFSEVLPFRTLCPDREQLSILFFSIVLVLTEQS